MGMRVDFKDFDKGMGQLVKISVPKDLDKGLFLAGNELLNDAIEKSPTAPFKTGALWRSARSERPAGAEKGTAVNSGFDIVYAARWHELTHEEDATINWTVPGVHRKYLETKLWMFGAKYTRTIGNYLKDRLGGK